MLTIKPENKIKTQKAKGIMYGISHITRRPPTSYTYCYDYGEQGERKYTGPASRMCEFFSSPTHKLIRNEHDAIKNLNYPCFARPCPTVPRHGFVDSVVITNRKDLLRLWKKVIKQDPNGEVILGPYMKKVDSNAVYVSSGNLAIGKGNDGATGGKDSISFPVAPYKFSNDLIKDSGLSKKDAVYLESVYSDSSWWLTQIRGGPAVDSVSPDYIPKAMKIKKVVKPNNDLLKWEKEVSEFKPGTVVYGKGHTLASHAAIHCVLNKVPFITTYEPEIGRMVKPTGNKTKKISREDFKKGLKAGLNICSKRVSEKDMYSYFYFSISVLHNWAYIKNSDHAGWLLGAASTLFSKICAALVHGEYRHINNNLYSDRGKIYKNVLKLNGFTFNKLPEIFKNFYSTYWSEGFGGVPWANCTWYTHSCWTNTVKIYNKTSKNLTEKEIADLVSIINRTVNLAHNNGWWFNKIAKKADLDFAADAPGLMAYCVADMYAELYTKSMSIKNTSKKIREPKKLPTPFTLDKDGKLTWVYLLYARRYSEIIVISEDGEENYKSVGFSGSQLKKIREAYDKDDVDYWERMLLTVKNGKFKFPGNNKYEDISCI